MSDTILKTRLVQKHDIEANWIKAGNATNPFIPLKGEIIVYDNLDKNGNKVADSVRYKIGDGISNINELPFNAENADSVQANLDTHTSNTDVHVTTTNKSNWNTAYTHSQSAHARTDATKVADSTTNGNILINGTETNVYTHPNSGVTAGTYKSVTVNAQGHITAGTNPTTLAGYGITDAEAKGAASSALASAKEYTDSVASGKSNTNHNHDTAYDKKGSADSALASAKSYADSAATTAATKVKNDLLNGAGGAYDTLKELGDLINDNQDAIDALETVAAGKADKSHSHAIADVSGLQSALDGKISKSGDTMTGNLTFATTKGIKYTAEDNDTQLWQVHDSSGAYGYALQYNGSGRGNNNDLVLISDNQNGTKINAVTMKQDGTTTFAKAITASGGVIGNASSATKATKDGKDNIIDETYVTKSSLATVATSGSYNDLSNKPTIPAAYSHPSTHPASMITGLATVATSGKYSDLSGTPTSMTPTAHNQASNTINAMTGYSKPSSTGAIATSDTLNAAIGKLEKALDGKQASGNYSTTGHKHTKSEITDFPTLATVATSGSYDDLSSKPIIPTVPTKVSAFENDKGYLTSYTETDPTVPAWAKASSKPSYTASEVGAMPSSEPVVKYTAQTLTEVQKAQVRSNIGAGASSFSGSYNDLSNKPDIPDALADLTSDSTHRTVTDTEKATWNAKSNFSGNYNDLTNKPAIPTKTSEITNDSGFITSSASLKNPNALTFGTKSYDGSSAKEITAADLGLSGAMKFLGTSSTAISDGSTTKTITVNGSSVTVAAGNVVLYNGNEFVWDGTKWEELGHEGSFKVKQTAVPSPSASGSTTAFIDTISQDANGNITATKKNVSFPVTSVAGKTGAVTLTKGDVGLDSVVNTGDSATPVSGGTTKFTTGGAYTELAKKVDKVSGKGLSTNDYTTTEKNKLAGIATGAEVNQNAFSNVVVGSTTIAADSKTDSLTIAAGAGISVSADETNDKVTITNAGIRSVATGSSNGTISVNANGASVDVAVKGLGSAAYTASSAYDSAGSASNALASAKEYTDEVASGKANTSHKHSVSHTPAGTVSKPTFTGSAVTSGKPDTTNATTIYSITDVGSVPSLTAAVSNRCLTLTWSAGSVPTRSSAISMPNANHTHSVTAAGSVSQPTFTGTEATLTTSTPK